MVLPDAIEMDVAVVGGGPAGIAAAASAAECGALVVLLDEQPALGGQIWRRGVAAPLAPDADRWMQRLVRSGARVEQGAAVADAWGLSDGDRFELRANRDGAALTVRARRVVLCTGARERFLPFPGWTLPRVVGAGGAQALIKSGMDVRGLRVVIAGSGPLLLPVAALVAGAGGHVALVAEQAPLAHVARFVAGLWRSPRLLRRAAALRRAFAPAEYAPGWWVTRAEGREQVERVHVTNGLTTRVIPCDLLCAGHGLVPETRLAALLGCEVREGAVCVDADQRTSMRGVFAAGEPTGIGGGDLALAEGEVAGFSSGGRPERAHSARLAAERGRRLARDMARAFALRSELRTLASPDTILCRCEDVPAGAIDPTGGFRRARMHCRLGMGACQGRICGDALAWLEGWPPEPPRAPLVPIPLSVLAAEPATFSHSAGA